MYAKVVSTRLGLGCLLSYEEEEWRACTDARHGLPGNSRSGTGGAKLPDTMRLSLSFGPVALLVVTAFVAQPLAAQDVATDEIWAFPIERFRPASDRNGVLDVESGAVRRHLAYDVGLFGSYSLNPLVLKSGGQRALSLVQHRVGAEAVASFGLFDWIQVGLAVPVVVFQTRDTSAVVDAVSTASDLGALGVGDLRVIPKVRILRADDQVVDLAIIPAFTIPSSATLAGVGSSYAGEGQFTLAPELAVSKPIGHFRLAGNVGYRLRPEERRVLNLVVGHELFYRAGVAFSFQDLNELPLEVGVSVNGATYAFQPFSSGFEENPLEGIVHGSYWVLPFLQAYAGVGAGVIAGFGAPDLRVLGGVRFSLPDGPVDRDGDGLNDDVDACAAAPEDKDGHEDADGCPDPDNDGDGVLDVSDSCPDVAGVVSYQGCPDPDTDDDGVLDADDECVAVPGVPELKGCPDLDKDDDGVLDADDRCVDVPGPDTFRGCPDTDGDNIPDIDDKCPTEPETRNGEEDDDGCPEKKKSVVLVKGDKIEILEKVYFDSGKATIQARSFGLLDKVASVFIANPQIGKVRVEGHTDDRGSDASNLALSAARAMSVQQYLVEKGVDASRLAAEGFGETRPIASNKTAAGRENNRRVEFTILEMNGKQVGPGADIRSDAAGGGAP